MQTEKRQAAIYCRVAHVDELALDIQRRALHSFAALKGFDVYAEYLDNGESGLTVDRPAFIWLNDDMLDGKIQTGLVINVSRIGRGIDIVFKWLDKARALDVEVISVNGDLPDGNIFLSLFHEMSKRK